MHGRGGRRHGVAAVPDVEARAVVRAWRRLCLARRPTRTRCPSLAFWGLVCLQPPLCLVEGEKHVFLQQEKNRHIYAVACGTCSALDACVRFSCTYRPAALLPWLGARDGLVMLAGCPSAQEERWQVAPSVVTSSSMPLCPPVVGNCDSSCAVAAMPVPCIVLWHSSCRPTCCSSAASSRASRRQGPLLRAGWLWCVSQALAHRCI